MRFFVNLNFDEHGNMIKHEILLKFYSPWIIFHGNGTLAALLVVCRLMFLLLFRGVGWSFYLWSGWTCCVSVGWSARWAVGRSVGRSVGWSVGRSVGRVIRCEVLIYVPLSRRWFLPHPLQLEALLVVT